MHHYHYSGHNLHCESVDLAAVEASDVFVDVGSGVQVVLLVLTLSEGPALPTNMLQLLGGFDDSRGVSRAVNGWMNAPNR